MRLGVEVSCPRGGSVSMMVLGGVLLRMVPL